METQRQTASEAERQNAEYRFEQIYRALFRDVYAYFYVCFGNSAAEDLTQEVFLRIWQAICIGKPPDSWRAWAFRCAVNLKNDVLRQKYARTKYVGAAMDAVNPAEDATAKLSAQLQVRAAWLCLSAQDRRLLFLKSQGYTSAEIGRRLLVSASTVRTRLQEAKRRFAEALRQEDA